MTTDSLPSSSLSTISLTKANSNCADATVTTFDTSSWQWQAGPGSDHRKIVVAASDRRALVESDLADASTDRSAEATLEFRVRCTDTPTRRLRLAGERYTLGNGIGCSVRLDDPSLRPLHAVLIRDAQRVLVRAYSVPFLLNDLRATEAILKVGDRLRLGAYEFELLSGPSDSPSKDSKKSTNQALPGSTLGPLHHEPSTLDTIRQAITQATSLDAESFAFDGSAPVVDRVTTLSAAEQDDPQRNRSFSEAQQQLDDESSTLKRQFQSLRQRESNLQIQERAAVQVHAEFQRRYEELAARQAALQTQQEQLNAEREASRRQQIQLEGRDRAQREQIDQLLCEHETLMQFREEAQLEVAQAEQRAQAASTAVEQMRAKFSALNSRLFELSDQQESLQKWHQQRASDYDSQVADLTQKHEAVLAERDQFKRRRDELEASESQLRSQTATLQQEIEASRRDAELLRRDCKLARDSIGELELLVKEHQDRHDADRVSWTEEVEQLRRGIDQLAVELSAAQQQIVQLTTDNERLATELEELQSQRDQMRHQRDEYKARFEAADQARQDALRQVDQARDLAARSNRDHDDTLEQIERLERETRHSIAPQTIDPLVSVQLRQPVALLKTAIDAVERPGPSIAGEMSESRSILPRPAQSHPAHPVSVNQRDQDKWTSPTFEPAESFAEPVESTPVATQFIATTNPTSDVASPSDAWPTYQDELTDATGDSGADGVAASKWESVPQMPPAVDETLNQPEADLPRWPDAELESMDQQAELDSPSFVSGAGVDQGNEPGNAPEHNAPESCSMEEVSRLGQTAPPRKEPVDAPNAHRDITPVASDTLAARLIRDLEQEREYEVGDTPHSATQSWRPGTEPDTYDEPPAGDAVDSFSPVGEACGTPGPGDDGLEGETRMAQFGGVDRYADEVEMTSGTYAFDPTEGPWATPLASPPLGSESSSFADHEAAGFEDPAERHGPLYTDESLEPGFDNFREVVVDEIAFEPGATTASTPNISDDTEEDSIEAYMNRLLQRVQGQSGSVSISTPIVTQKPEPTSKSTSRSAIHASTEVAPEPAPAPPKSEPIDPDAPLVPRSQAPEKNSNLTAMRDLANESARSAITRSVKTQAYDTQVQAMVKLAQGGIAIVCGVAAMMLVTGVLQVVAALAALIIAGVCVREGMILLAVARQRQAKPIATEEPTDDNC